MKTRVFASWLVLVSITPGSLPVAHAQTSDGDCLRPLPNPRAVFLRSRDQKGGVGFSETEESLFITPSGRLCRAVPLRPSGGAPFQVATNRAPKPGRAFLLSSALPGAGQWYLGQDRWPAYLAVEIWAWIQFLDWRREGRRVQGQYRDLAWLVARRVSAGPRTDAGWDYYEALTHFQASGAYDGDPQQPGIQPEGDPGTFNGSIWALAQEIYLPRDPEDPGNPVEEGSEPYEKAFEYYLSRAYDPTLAWDWGANTLHREEYTALIRKADEALRSSTGMIGVILANHLLSAVDALVSGRLGIAGRAEPSMEVLLRPGPFHRRQVSISVRIPNPLSHDH